MMSDEKLEMAESAIVPRAERKTGRVEVEKVGQTVVQAESNSSATLTSSPEKDDDPNPAPKTNTKHSAATAKAREADRPSPQVVTPVIVDEPQAEPSDPIQEWIETHTLADLVTLVIAKTASSDDAAAKVKTAKQLRKLADTLDPPTKFVKPTVEDVAEYCRERRNNIDPEAFVAHYAANGWRLANGNKLNDWKSAVITWEKRNDSGSKQVGRAIAGTCRIKPDAIDESAITWK
jgi:hypothetical protein